MQRVPISPGCRPCAVNLDTPGTLKDTEATMARRRLLTLLVLALWVTFGPVAMAFGGCFLMGAMCDGPCGTSSPASFAPAPAMGLGPISYLDAELQDRLPENTLANAEPPPTQFSLAS